MSAADTQGKSLDDLLIERGESLDEAVVKALGEATGYQAAVVEVVRKRQVALVITKLQEALLWLRAEETLP